MMKNNKKLTAVITAVSLAATMSACSAPAIGAGTANAVTIDGYDVPAGVFIFYTLSAYNDAASIVAKNGENTSPTTKEVEKAHIDNLEAAEWIQNKATDYCKNFVAIEKEFEKIGGTLSAEDLDEVKNGISTYSSYSIYSDNGIGEESIRKILENESKSQYIFDYYYGFEGEKGVSEDELKDYFDENFARVKYVDISVTDSTTGEKLSDDEVQERKELAESYAKQINEKSKIEDKMAEVDKVQEAYDQFVADKQAEADAAAAAESGEAVTTTTTAATTTAETETTTTTTDPYANERLVQKETTTTADEDAEDDAATTTTTQSPAQIAQKKLNDYIFGELEQNKAEVVDGGDDIYVVVRADLRERMTEDDYWAENYIQGLQSMKFGEDYEDFLEEIVKNLNADRNKSAYRRYAPFKLTLEASN